MKLKVKKVWGLVLHFGYVESSVVSSVIIHHAGDGFSSAKIAITHLAHYFLEDYLGRLQGTATVDCFKSYLYSIPQQVASGGVGDTSFDSEHANCEEWWPWDSLSQILPYMDRFYEIDFAAEDVLIQHLNPRKIDNEDFVNDLAAVRKDFFKHSDNIHPVKKPRKR